MYYIHCFLSPWRHSDGYTANEPFVDYFQLVFQCRYGIGVHYWLHTSGQSTPLPSTHLTSFSLVSHLTTSLRGTPAPIHGVSPQSLLTYAGCVVFCGLPDMSHL